LLPPVRLAFVKKAKRRETGMVSLLACAPAHPKYTAPQQVRDRPSRYFYTIQPKQSRIGAFHTINILHRFKKEPVMNEKASVNAIVTAVKIDLSRGMKKEEVLRSLSGLISRELFIKVREQIL
jgi:hypothetical protein